MNKKLTSKTQHLSPKPLDSTKVFAKSISIEPENKELLLKKGVVHAVFKIRETNEFDSNLVTKVVYDMLHDTYYQSESVSPIQSLEKAITQVRDNVSKLSNESISAVGGDLKFDIVASVLWGNVYYIVKYGSGQAYMVRGTEIASVNTMSEGNFASASNLVKDEDVVILCTDEFAQAYPPKKLLETQLGETDLGAGQACVLVKFQVDTTLSVDEAVDFGIDIKEKKAPKKPNKITSLFKRKPKDMVPQTAKPEPRKLQTLVSPIADTPKIKVKSTLKPKMRLPIKYLIPVVAAVLVISIVWTVKSKQETGEQELPITPIPTQDNTANTLPPEVPATAGLEGTKTSELAAFNSTLVAADTGAGKLYTSSTDELNFEPLEGDFAGIHALQNYDGKLRYLTTSAAETYNLSTDKVEESFTTSELKHTSNYLDFVYSLEGNEIVKYTKSGDSLDGSTWATAAEFDGAKDLEAAYSIFVITKDNDIVSYTGGDKDTDFTITGLETPLKDATQVLTSVDFDNLYVLDKGLKRVVSIDKDGNFVKEYTSTDWQNPSAIAVDSGENTLFVLDGNRVYKIGL